MNDILNGIIANQNSIAHTCGIAQPTTSSTVLCHISGILSAFASRRPRFAIQSMVGGGGEGELGWMDGNIYGSYTEYCSYLWYRIDRNFADSASSCKRDSFCIRLSRPRVRSSLCCHRNLLLRRCPRLRSKQE